MSLLKLFLLILLKEEERNQLLEEAFQANIAEDLKKAAFDQNGLNL